MYRTIVEERAKNIAVMDVFSKLVQERILFIDESITPELANGIIAQMLYLDSLNHDPIEVYINSPGGYVLDGLAIYDISKLIKSPINTTCIGMAASMGAILMFMGKNRYATKHSRIMLHEPSAVIGGKTSDIQIDHDQILQYKTELCAIVEENTTLTNTWDLFKFDKWFNSKEALECGLITKIL